MPIEEASSALHLQLDAGPGGSSVSGHPSFDTLAAPSLIVQESFGTDVTNRVNFKLPGDSAGELEADQPRVLVLPEGLEFLNQTDSMQLFVM
jgi:hypothetical protein